jgi:hypothetical protein
LNETHSIIMLHLVELATNQRRVEMKDQAHDHAMADLFREDPALALATVETILTNGDLPELLVAARQINLAFGGASINATPCNEDPRPPSAEPV